LNNPVSSARPFGIEHDYGRMTMALREQAASLGMRSDIEPLIEALILRERLGCDVLVSAQAPVPAAI
jgi:hypothetical protein